MVTSELQVTGMMPVMAQSLSVSISSIGYLISIYAFAMAVGGPLLTMLLLRFAPKAGLMILYATFLIGEVLGAMAPSYGSLIVARLITGAVSGAFFGVALAICVELVDPKMHGRGISIVLGGLMLGTVLGLPLASLVGDHFGWRESFWSVSLLSLVSWLVSMGMVPALAKKGHASLAEELSALKSKKLWAAFSTSMLIIGATYSAFSYFTPILKDVAGFSSNWVSILLLVYGAATVIGNNIVGRLADRHTIPVLVSGLVLLAAFLTLFGLFVTSKAIVVVALIGVGLVGVTMNPAMVTRVMRTANGRPLVNTVHTSVITMGVVVGAFLGGIGISAGFGLLSPLWIGVAMAVAGLISLWPEMRGTPAGEAAKVARQAR